MLLHFANYIRSQHLFSPGEEVLLAVSGGRDSVCMAHLFHLARIPFAIAHCNFHLRPGDCDRDEFFVRNLARSFHVPFLTIGFDTKAHAKAHGMSIEEAARELRYRWFATLCSERGFASVAVAHHRDDSIETLFLNLFRGTGLAGLHGIRPQTTLYGIRIIRPMLCFSRADIDRYVDEHELAFVEDSTNQSLDARRNRIRNKLMPWLRTDYPAIDKTMAANIRRFAEAEQIYHNYIDLVRQQHVHILPRRVPTMPAPVTSVSLYDLPEPRATILFELLRPYGANEDNVHNILGGKMQTGACISCDTCDLIVNRGGLIIGERLDPVKPTLALAEEERFSRGKLGIFVDAARIVFPLSVRQRQPGDTLHPLGFDHSRHVSDVLKDMKLSLYEKRYVWLVVDANDRIVWIIGLLQDHRFRVTGATRNVLYITAAI